MAKHFASGRNENALRGSQFLGTKPIYNSSSPLSDVIGFVVYPDFPSSRPPDKFDKLIKLHQCSRVRFLSNGSQVRKKASEISRLGETGTYSGGPLFCQTLSITHPCPSQRCNGFCWLAPSFSNPTQIITYTSVFNAHVGFFGDAMLGKNPPEILRPAPVPFPCLFYEAGRSLLNVEFQNRHSAVAHLSRRPIAPFILPTTLAGHFKSQTLIFLHSSITQLALRRVIINQIFGVAGIMMQKRDTQKFKPRLLILVLYLPERISGQIAEDYPVQVAVFAGAQTKSW